MIHLEPDIANLCVGSASVVAQILAIEGEVVRELGGRRTLRFAHQGRSYYLKAHFGVGWGEILKNLVSLRLPIIGARNEWQAIHRLQALGVQTMELAGYGIEGYNPACLKSFVITRDLGALPSLEDYCPQWACGKLSSSEIIFKRQLLFRIATISRMLHHNGVNHRDYYLCHFLLDRYTNKNFHLYLIDLHRVQLRSKTPMRWVVKDIGGLYFSALDIGLNQRDLLRFLRLYFNAPLRRILVEQVTFLQAVRVRARRLYQSLHQRLPTEPL